MPNTQGMGVNSDGHNYNFSVSAGDPNLSPPLDIPKRTIFTPEERAELKAIFKEALAEIHMHTS